MIWSIWMGKIKVYKMIMVWSSGYKWEVVKYKLKSAYMEYNEDIMQLKREKVYMNCGMSIWGKHATFILFIDFDWSIL